MREDRHKQDTQKYLESKLLFMIATLKKKLKLLQLIDEIPVIGRCIYYHQQIRLVDTGTSIMIASNQKSSSLALASLIPLHVIMTHTVECN